MSETKTQANASTVPPIATEAQPVAKVDPEKQQRREAWEGFQAELAKRADEIGSQLPPNISFDRFKGAALAAVKATPAILTATPRSLFSALVKAAQDGLLPDGREGIITVFSTKVPNTTPQQYENIAQWNPMFYGIRKRARELDGIIIDAQVVVEGDEFDYELGDQPRINHKPKTRAEVIDAAKGVAVYAIFRHPTEGILHREVMWKPEVFAVMNQSRAKDSLMWTKFWTEGWRKTVGRRGAKSVPVSPALERLITRDDENFDFPKSSVMIAGPTTPTPPPPPPEETETLHNSDQPEGGKSEGTIISGTSTEVEKINTPADEAGDFNNDQSNVTYVPDGEITPDVRAKLDNIKVLLDQATSEADLIEAFDKFDVQTAFAGNEAALDQAFGIRRVAITALAHKQRDDLEAAGQGGFEFPGDAPMPKGK